MREPPRTPDRELLEIPPSRPDALRPDVISGFLAEEEGWRLAYLAARVPGHLAILEIGAMRGRSMCYMAHGAGEGHMARIWSIDHWGLLATEAVGDWEDNRLRYQMNVERFGLTDRVTGIQATSGDMAQEWTRPLGLLLIDGDHTAEGIAIDYEGFAQWIVPGGWLAVHDYMPHFKAVYTYCNQTILPSGLWERISVRHTLLTMRRKQDVAS